MTHRETTRKKGEEHKKWEDELTHLNQLSFFPW